MCFSVDNPDSYLNVQDKWAPEIKKYCPKVPIILVGNKIDLRNDKNVIKSLMKTKREPIKHEQGLEMANKIGACTYLECSAKRKEGIQVIFETAARVVLKAGCSRKLKKRKCKIL
jgi:GTPase SAR1 family protein